MDSDKDLDRRRVEAARRFLAAVERYDDEGTRDGRFIVESYLAKFDDKDGARAKVAIEIAKDTSNNIASFRTELVGLSSKVSLAMMSSEGELLSATVDSMSTIFEHFHAYLDDVNSHLLSRAGKKSQIRTNGELNAKLDRIKDNAREIMELTISVAELASEIIEARCDTLRDFRENNLEASRKLFIGRLRKLLDDAPREATFDAFRKVAQKVFDEVFEIGPVVRWIFWLKKKVDKIVRPAGTKAGDTDVMLNLLPALKSTSKLADELRLAYARALNE